MIRHVATFMRKPHQHRAGRQAMTLSKRLAASPLSLACTSFLVTALLIGSDALTVLLPAH